MNTLTPDSVRALILEHCQEGLRASGRDPASLPDDFDLLAESVVDSLGILQLIAAIEQKCAITIDLEKLDADQLTRIGPLSRFIAQNGGAASPQT